MLPRFAAVLTKHALLPALACALLAACGGTDVERRPPPSGRATAAPDAGRTNLGRWEHAEALASFRRVTRVRSQHLGGGLDGEITANEAAAAYPTLGPRGELAAGAVLAETHYAPGRQEPSVVFAMVKRQPGFDPEGGDWEYLVVAPSGEIEARGKLPACARCHAEAPHGGVFGPPRAAAADAGP